MVPSGAAYYAHDEQGRTLGEYDANLVPVAETVYIGDVPVAVLKQTGSAAAVTVQLAVGNVYADQINTPRVVTRNSDEAILWQWDATEAFGNSPPQQNPSGLGTYTYNQRMPGQIYDVETGTFYNINRDFQPLLGRYAQSDPIGLNGGVNTYQYVNGSPLMHMDPYGLLGMDDVWGGVYWATAGWSPSQGTTNAWAGFGDSMSMGITGYVRTGLGIGTVNKCSSAYRKGEVVDLAFEAGTMGLSAGLKYLAKGMTQQAARKGTRPLVDAFREARNLDGGFVHHANPLLGNPGSIGPTMCPTAGLPAWINGGAWNLKWVSDRAAHAAAHVRTKLLEDGWRAFVNPATWGIRAARDAADACTCQD